MTATVNDDGAEVSGVTLGGTEITDTDFTDGITVPSLVEGDNVIVVTVTAEDTTTTQTYTITVTRVAATVTISADKTSGVLKGDDLTYTLARTGPTTDDLPVTVVLTQTGEFLAAADLTKTVTILAGQSTQTFTVAATSFQHFPQGDPVEGGTLTATVQAGTDYGSVSVDVAIVVGLTVGFEMASYSVAEEAGTLEVKLVALTGERALTPDTDATISFYTAELDPLEAQIVHDYESESITVTFAPSDFSADGSVFKAEKTVSVTIVDNTMDEQDERFALLLDIAPGLSREHQNFVDTDGASCQDTLLCPALVTITDTDIASADITGIEITSAPANGISYLQGEVITVSVTYDEAVAVTTTSGTPTLDLEIGPMTRAASYTSISSDNLTLTFSYTVAGDDQDQNGIVIPAGSIDLNGGTITRQGTSAAALLAYPGLGQDGTQRVNRDPAVISGGVAVTSSPTAKTDTYGVGETIRFTVTFETPVAVDTTGGTSVLKFRLANTGGSTNRDMDYVSGSGTAVWTFEYVVQSGDKDTNTNGILMRNNALRENGGAITHTTTGGMRGSTTAVPATTATSPATRWTGLWPGRFPTTGPSSPPALGAASSSGSSSTLPWATTLRTPTSRSTTTLSGIRSPCPATPPSSHTAPRSMPWAAPPPPTPATTPTPPTPPPIRASPSTGSTAPRWPTSTRISTTVPGTTRPTTRPRLAPTGSIPPMSPTTPGRAATTTARRLPATPLATPRPASAGPTPPTPATAPSAAAPQSPMSSTAPCTGYRRSSAS